MKRFLGRHFTDVTYVLIVLKLVFLCRFFQKRHSRLPQTSDFSVSLPWTLCYKQFPKSHSLVSTISPPPTSVLFLNVYSTSFPSSRPFNKVVILRLPFSFHKTVLLLHYLRPASPSTLCFSSNALHTAPTLSLIPTLTTLPSLHLLYWSSHTYSHLTATVVRFAAHPLLSLHYNHVRLPQSIHVVYSYIPTPPWYFPFHQRLSLSTPFPPFPLSFCPNPGRKLDNL